MKGIDHFLDWMDKNYLDIVQEYFISCTEEEE